MTDTTAPLPALLGLAHLLRLLADGRKVGSDYPDLTCKLRATTAAIWLGPENGWDGEPIPIIPCDDEDNARDWLAAAHQTRNPGHGLNALTVQWLYEEEEGGDWIGESWAAWRYDAKRGWIEMAGLVI